MRNFTSTYHSYSGRCSAGYPAATNTDSVCNVFDTDIG